MIVYFHFSFLIMNRKTNHSSKLEKDYQLVTSPKNDKYCGCCKLRWKSFLIDSSGIS